jgi:hypothetical protein
MGGPQALPQQEIGEENGEERGELVEHVGVRQHHAVDGVEIARQAQGPGGAPAQQVQPAAPGHPKGGPPAQQHPAGQEQGDEVAEEDLLHAGQIARLVNESRHGGKAHGGQHGAYEPTEAGRDVQGQRLFLQKPVFSSV